MKKRLFYLTGEAQTIVERTKKPSLHRERPGTKKLDEGEGEKMAMRRVGEEPET